MNDTIPSPIKKDLDQLVTYFQKTLNENLLGIYLHGSAAMGSYNAESSDIDILVVTQDKLSQEKKTELSLAMLSLSTPTRKYELSIITQSSLENFQYPTPYEFHYSEEWREKYQNKEENFSLDRTDPDLAAHLLITKKRGICLFGKPIENLFPEIPKNAYVDSIVKDSDWSYQNIQKGPNNGNCRVPTYAVLNFCRVLAYLQEDLITSKKEGGEWAVKNLPPEYHSLIIEALNEYRKQGSSHEVNCMLLKQFSSYAQHQISQSPPT